MGQLGRLRQLGPGDLPALQALFERCAAFFELVFGAPPRKDEARRWLLEEVPAGKTLSDKTAFGLVDDEDRLVGAVDAVRDHPAPGEFWLGTMVIEPSIRGVGLGAGLHGQVLRWVREQGGRAVGLQVQRQNPGAIRFWAREGYLETGVRRVRNGRMENEVVTMRLEL